MSEVKSTTTKLVIARSISCFGSSFSDFILPLLVYETTKNPSLLATQWALNAFSKVVAGKIAGRFHILQTNKQAIVLLDVLQAIAALLPFILWQSYQTTGIFISGLLISFLFTLQIGYIESSIFKMTQAEQNETATRGIVNASLENGKYIGQFLGYLCALACSTLVGYRFAILIDSSTFLLSALITLTIIDKSKNESKDKVKESFSLLFKNTRIALLTLSQCFLSFAIFIYNSSFTYTLKETFVATNEAFALFLISQALTYICGSFIAKRYRVLSLKWHFNLRSFYLPIFIGFFVATNYWQFLIFNCLLSLLISFTQPQIVAIFQSFTTNQNARSFGAARVSLMAISGILGSVSCAVFAKSKFPYQNIFLIAAFACVFSILTFKYFSRHGQQTDDAHL